MLIFLMWNAIAQSGMELGGRYLLERLIGRGGMGEVWQGTDRRLRRPVAVKVLSPDAATGDTAVARLRREAEAAGALQHPAITVVFDVGEEPLPDVPGGRLVYLVMELLDGRDLRTVLGVAPGGLPVPQAVSLAAQVAEGLAAAHARGVVHRDVKPANLFVLPDGRVKICDFGIARLVDGTRLTMDGSTIGTPHYMAPEQFGGEAGHRADLYSLGCVLYELLTGTPPFSAEGGMARLMYQHLNTAPAPLPDSVPADVRALVAELLAKDAADRPADAATVARRLRGGEPEASSQRLPAPQHTPTAWQVPAGPAGGATRVDARGGRRGGRGLKIAVAAGAAVLVAAAGVAFALSVNGAEAGGDGKPSSPPAVADRGAAVPTVDGWHVITSAERGVAYDVPPTWTPGAAGYEMAYFDDATEKPIIGAASVAYIKQETGDGNGCYLALAGVRGGSGGIVDAAPGQAGALAAEAGRQARQWAAGAFSVGGVPPVLDAGTSRTLTLTGGVRAQVHSFTVRSVAGADSCNATRPGARVHVLTAASRVPGRDGGPFAFSVLTGPDIRFAEQDVVEKILRSVRSTK
ncbi:serine/threonine-protein kinase [Actinomadura geliboluensis]|uniref:serine/threonine-protein kinase n=1 Tax=Actinomadura geliboluensis TaxID=882440 RepID=UPI0037144C79